MKHLFIFTLIFFLICSEMFSQQLQVHGKLMDDRQNPIPGVSILVKGTLRGTISNPDGSFSLEAVLEEVLVFSCVGFKTE